MARAGAFQVAGLQCEHLVNPLGIEAPAPLLTWRLQSDERGERQSACQLLVASSRELLHLDRGDLWDSGRLATEDTIGHLYAGQALVAQEHAYWKVRVWDQAGRAVWSEPAEWSMGLLQPADWSAQWIGYDAERERLRNPAALAAAQWIWLAADGANPPAGKRLFQKVLTLPAEMQIKSAQLTLTADDGFECAVNGTLVATNAPGDESWRHPRVVEVAAQLHGGDNQILVAAENTTPSPAGLLGSLVVTLVNGEVLTQPTDGTWQAAVHPGAGWVTQPLADGAWTRAQVLGTNGVQPWGPISVEWAFLPPVPLLRQEFAVGAGLRRATLYASALGLVEVHVNGARLGEDYFTPGWTDYTKRVHYRTYDVTAQLRPGKNAVGALLADGWYSGYVGYAGHRDYYGQKPRARLQLHLEYADGSQTTLGTGPDWQAATGPVLSADFLRGETYDARKELPGWDKPGFNAAGWEPVVAGSELQPVMEAHEGPPVRVFAEFPAKTITEPKPGVYVLNLGQNFAGMARLKVRGTAGQRITLRFAERLNPDGTVYTTNLRTATATDTYICRGGGLEIWQPQFTFHGFQYIEVTGLTGRPDRDTVVGLALSSATPVTGSFACSDPLLNQLHQNIYYTQRANFIDIPTDCPQRDERLGWTGDAQVYVRTATLNCDVSAFYTKWLVDLMDGQRADGQFPMVAPVKIAGDDGGPAWADSGVICPWTIYDAYGDRRILERCYPHMQRFIAFCQQRSKPNLLPPAKYHCFGDWLSLHADTPKDVIYTAYFAYSTRLTARAAEVLGKTEDAAKYNDLFQRIKAAFNQAYVTDDGRVKGDTQAGYVLALGYDLVDGVRAERAAQHLVANIQARGWHLSTGFIGTKDLMLVLAKIGRNDVACRLVHNDTFPSWGFSIKNGATSIWERWDGWTPEKGFQDPGMNSFAHYSFGAVYQWMVENLGGIHNNGGVWKRMVIAPQMYSRLTQASTGVDTVRGRVQTDWQRKGEDLQLTVTLPANTTATVVVPMNPAAADDSLTEGGHPIAKVKGVKWLQREAAGAVLAVESGTYHFRVKTAILPQI